MSARPAAIAAFLDGCGWGSAVREPLAADASFRRYQRLRRGAESAVLMDAPPDRMEVRPFLDVAATLQGWGYSAPAVLAAEPASGLVLLEDLGDDSYTRVAAQGGDEADLYRHAVDLLVDLHRRPAAHLAGLPPYDMAFLLREVALVVDWYLPALTGTPVAEAVRADYLSRWQDALGPVGRLPSVFTFRDYMADNLIWLPARNGIRRVGLLDFQDAVIGCPAYDLASLLEDIRRDVPRPLAENLIRRYIDKTGVEAAPLREAYAVLAAQRNAKIVGLFTRLWKRDGKPRYQDYLPRAWELLTIELGHPKLGSVAAWFDRHIPPGPPGPPGPTGPRAKLLPGVPS